MKFNSNDLFWISMGGKPNPKPNLIGFGAPNLKTVCYSKPKPTRSGTCGYPIRNHPAAILILQPQRLRGCACVGAAQSPKGGHPRQQSSSAMAGLTLMLAEPGRGVGVCLQWGRGSPDGDTIEEGAHRMDRGPETHLRSLEPWCVIRDAPGQRASSGCAHAVA
jgi:hypothetical protein